MAEMSISNFTSQFYFDSQEKSCGENIKKNRVLTEKTIKLLTRKVLKLSLSKKPTY